MSPFEQQDWIHQLVEHPHDAAVLRGARAEVGGDPARYSALLEEVANQSSQPDAASHFLTEAAVAQLSASEETEGAQGLLVRALELDPMNSRAAAMLSEIYRSDDDQATLGKHLKARAEALDGLSGSDPALSQHAADAYEALGIHYSERMGDHERGVKALRRALALHRGSASLEPQTPTPKRHETAAPPQSALRTRERDSNLVPQPRRPGDTLPSESDEPPPSSARSETPTQVDALKPRESVRAFSLVSAPGSLEPSVARDEDRGSGDRLIGLFEALHAVRFCQDALEAAALVVQIARDALGAESGMVHLYDLSSREYVVSAALGEHHRTVVGLRTPDGDPLLEHAQRETAAVVANRPASFAMLTGERWDIVDAKRSVLCAPAQFDGIIYGAVELVDPKGRATFDVRDQDALTYVGERIAEFMAEHEPVLG